MRGESPFDNPYTVRVVGSATLRVEPDTVVVNFSVTEIKPHPKEAFEAVREASRKVQAFLAASEVEEFGSSNIVLREETQHTLSEQKLIGYRTTVDFRIVIANLNRMEDILTGLVDAGASNIRSVDFQTTRLEALRTEVRRLAVANAREKALVYCEAAGIPLGEVIQIEDITLDPPPRTALRASLVANAGDPQAFDPGKVTITGSILVAFKIGSASTPSV